MGRFLAGRSPGIHLSAEGRRQAASLVARLEAGSLAAVYSSPLERALETAAPLAAAAGLEVRTGAGAAEAADPRWRAFNTARSITQAGTARPRYPS